MADTNELARVAAAMNAIRPEWNQASLLTFLTRNHASRPYVDLAIAGVAVALDEKTQTPQLLNSHGPWWVAAGHASRKATPTVGPGAEPRCTVDGHEFEIARACRCCRADRLAADNQED